METIALLEELSMNAWPPEVLQTVEGWRLRFTRRVSRRANSAWTNHATGASPLLQRIECAEAFYAERAADSCFHLSPASHPHEPALDTILADRGYSRNGDTYLQTARIDDVLRADHRGADVEVSASPHAAWTNAAWPSADLKPDVRLQILARIGPPIACALARVDGTAAAVGLGVCERGHVGVFSMRTEEWARGRGLASAILGRLAQWGGSLGAERAYLQVEVDNPTAQRLYTRAGFETAYAYHYRSRSA